PSRRYCWFLAIDKTSGKQVFGEALAFYEVLSDGASELYVAYQELTDVETVPGTIHGKPWSDATQMLPTSNIIDIVGIWDETSNIYIIQKHPALDLLTPEECGIDIEDNDNEAV
ncbi:hypothetical protein BDZ94DRAFT_1316381, partial [Collybia nuda]